MLLSGRFDIFSTDIVESQKLVDGRRRCRLLDRAGPDRKTLDGSHQEAGHGE